MGYPKILYHATLAPEGRKFRTAADDPPADAGWVDTPEKFNPDYVAPRPVEGQSPNRPGYVPQKYPTIRYRRNGDALRVLSAEAARALEPGVWAETPDGPWDEPAPGTTPPPAAPAPSAPATTSPRPAPAPAVPPPPSAPVATPEAPPAATPPSGNPVEEAASQYAATVTEIADHLPKVKDKAILEKILAYEEDNPKGPRIGVVKAVAKRLDELAPPPVTPPVTP